MHLEERSKVQHCNLCDCFSLGTVMKLIMAQTQWFKPMELGFSPDSVMAKLMRNSGSTCRGGIEGMLAKAGRELGNALLYSEELDVSERLTVKLLQNPAAMELAGTELAKMFWQRGINHVVVHVVPQLHSQRVSGQEEKTSFEAEMMFSLLAGIRYVESISDVKIELVLGMLENEKKDERLANLRTIWLAKKFKDRGVIGVELLGDRTRKASVMLNLARKNQVEVCA